MQKLDDVVAKVQKVRKKARSLTKQLKALTEEELHLLLTKKGATEEEVMKAIDKAMKCAKAVREHVC
tara:strand:+ start:318 stop:518 length:201 start_codon:yes stop_codon:yes gene_type:complete